MNVSSSLTLTPDNTFARDDIPSLKSVCDVFGLENISTAWLYPLFLDLANASGTKVTTDTADALKGVTDAALAEYQDELTPLEMLLFCRRFKAGRYGKFYGAVDPLVITSCIPIFLNIRNETEIKKVTRKREEEKRKAQEQQWAEELRRDPPKPRLEASKATKPKPKTPTSTPEDKAREKAFWAQLKRDYPKEYVKLAPRAHEKTQAVQLTTESI